MVRLSQGFVLPHPRICPSNHGLSKSFMSISGASGAESPPHSFAVPLDPLCGEPFETLQGVRVFPIETAK